MLDVLWWETMNMNVTVFVQCFIGFLYGSYVMSLPLCLKAGLYVSDTATQISNSEIFNIWSQLFIARAFTYFDHKKQLIKLLLVLEYTVYTTDWQCALAEDIFFVFNLSCCWWYLLVPSSKAVLFRFAYARRWFDKLTPLWKVALQWTHTFLLNSPFSVEKI